MNSTHRATNRMHALPASDAALDHLLQETAAREWPGSNRNPRIEEFLVNEVSKKQRSRRLGLFLGLGALLATSAVFGAARLYDQYTVRVLCDDGQSYEGTFVANPDGTGQMDITLADGSAGTMYFTPVGEDGHLGVSAECELSGEPCNLGTVAATEGQITLDCTRCPAEACDKACEQPCDEKHATK